jgi:hypothetical protein
MCPFFHSSHTHFWVSLQVHIVLQYCDKGTLEHAVKAGHFKDELGRTNMVRIVFATFA